MVKTVKLSNGARIDKDTKLFADEMMILGQIHALSENISLLEKQKTAKWKRYESIRNQLRKLREDRRSA